MARHNQIGEWGEQVCREYLTARGYAVMEHNVHMGHKELDIVAMKGDRIIFVEVKTRSTDLTDPAEAIDRRKISRIVSAANSFLTSHEYPHEAQFDVMIVIGTPGTGYSIEHIPDAFMPPLKGAR